MDNKTRYTISVIDGSAATTVIIRGRYPGRRSYREVFRGHGPDFHSAMVEIGQLAEKEIELRNAMIAKLTRKENT